MYEGLSRSPDPNLLKNLAVDISTWGWLQQQYALYRRRRPVLLKKLQLVYERCDAPLPSNIELRGFDGRFPEYVSWRSRKFEEFQRQVREVDKTTSQHDYWDFSMEFMCLNRWGEEDVVMNGLRAARYFSNLRIQEQVGGGRKYGASSILCQVWSDRQWLISLLVVSTIYCGLFSVGISVVVVLAQIVQAVCMLF
jgi:hypothetical protein